MGKHHDTLGVSSTATEGEIKKAYRKLASELHPDKTGGDKVAEERLKAVNQAYSELKKGNADPEPEFHGGSGTFSDIRNAWEAMRRAQNSGPMESNARIAVTVDTICNGGKTRINLQVPMNTGRANFMMFSTIQAEIVIPKDHPLDKTITTTVNNITLHVQIAPHSPSEFFDVNLARRRNIEVAHMDGKYHLHETIQLDAFTAMLGGEHRFIHPDGRVMNITIPENTTGDKIVRVAGQGLNTISYGRGDYLLHIEVTTRSLNSDQIKILRDAVAEIDSKNS